MSSTGGEPSNPEPPPGALRDVLEEARGFGFLGPGPVADHERHALAMAVFAGEPTGTVLDLGSGGGVPGLVLAQRWPGVEVVLLDAMHRRCAFLRDAVTRLDLRSRVRIVEGRAEALAREPSLREAFELVVARGFATPAVTAECAVGFLRPGGRLVVSEPPDGDEGRWPADGLAVLALAATRAGTEGGSSFVELRRTGPLHERWPRRTGIPAKRPLW